MHEWFTLEYQPIANVQLRADCIAETENRMHICIQGQLPEDVCVGDWQMRVTPTFTPSFFYTPHLTPTQEHVIDMHVFRTPAMMMGCGSRVLCVLPVTEGVQDGVNRYYMDFDAPNACMTLGITTTQVTGHVMYCRTGEAVLPAGPFCFEARILLLEGAEAENPFRSVLSYYWTRYGREDSRHLTACKDLFPYVEHTYSWAFDRWKNVVWQEFELNGKRVGAPQMIVTAQQSPNCTEAVSIRESVSIWNQAWFSSLRSAQGLYRYGKETGNAEYVHMALMTKELALQLPQEDGLFDTVVACPSETVLVDGKEIRRSMGWEHLYFGNSNRNPVTAEIGESPKHVLDMSWTALKMLEWYEELERDERLLEYAKRYADRLLRLQNEKGYFPAWLDQKTGEALEELRQSPECAVSVSLLVRLGRLTGEARYLESAFQCMDVLVREILPESRWEDFETYWSCSCFGAAEQAYKKYECKSGSINRSLSAFWMKQANAYLQSGCCGAENMVGKKYERNGIYKQCSLSPFWMAQALYDCYMETKDTKYLKLGERCLDEMLMFQSSYQPSYIPITVVGGFGVMNCDAELNDARQSLFAELIAQYGRLLNRQEYTERAAAALRASFSMMYCPENPFAKAQWEKRWPFFNERDYGFMMENYGHDGYVNGKNLGLGAFTIYDWGNGAASEAVLRIRAHFPELFQDCRPIE